MPESARPNFFSALRRLKDWAKPLASSSNLSFITLHSFPGSLVHFFSVCAAISTQPTPRITVVGSIAVSSVTGDELRVTNTIWTVTSRTITRVSASGLKYAKAGKRTGGPIDLTSSKFFGLASFARVGAGGQTERGQQHASECAAEVAQC